MTATQTKVTVPEFVNNWAKVNNEHIYDRDGKYGHNLIDAYANTYLQYLGNWGTTLGNIIDDAPEDKASAERIRKVVDAYFQKLDVEIDTNFATWTTTFHMTKDIFEGFDITEAQTIVAYLCAREMKTLIEGYVEDVEEPDFTEKDSQIMEWVQKAIVRVYENTFEQPLFAPDEEETEVSDPWN